MFGSIIGGAISGIGSLLGQKSANEANSAQALRSMNFSEAEAARSRAFAAHTGSVNRNFQERHIRNRYEYTMNSMRHAGLNPILAYAQGGGGTPSGSAPSAGMGSGAQATMQNSMAGVADAFGKTVNSALSAKLNKKTLERMDEEIKNLKASNIAIKQASLKDGSQAILNQEQAKKVLEEKFLTQNALEVSDQEKKQRKIKGEFAGANPLMLKMERVMEALGKLLGGGNSAKTLLK